MSTTATVKAVLGVLLIAVGVSLNEDDSHSQAQSCAGPMYSFYDAGCSQPAMPVYAANCTQPAVMGAYTKVGCSGQYQYVPTASLAVPAAETPAPAPTYTAPAESAEAPAPPVESESVSEPTTQVTPAQPQYRTVAYTPAVAYTQPATYQVVQTYAASNICPNCGGVRQGYSNGCSTYSGYSSYQTVGHHHRRGLFRGGWFRGKHGKHAASYSSYSTCAVHSPSYSYSNGYASNGGMYCANGVCYRM